MTAKPCKFIWYDVMTTDVKAAKSFYTKVIGWTAQEAPPPNNAYTIFSVGSDKTGGIGGLMALPPDAKAKGVPPCWSGYIGVPDVDDYTKRVKSAGGSVRQEPQDIPNVGRFAVVADPQGAVFLLFKPNPRGEECPPVPLTALGQIGWNELHSTDPEKGFAFYEKLFGWTKVRAMDMGPEMGVYQLFAAGGEACGGMMKKMPQAPMSYWLYYFNVDSIAAAMKRVTGAGGKVLMGPQEVPGPMWIAQCLDPQGAMFAMVSVKQ
jgi:uncharacterized protein